MKRNKLERKPSQKMFKDPMERLSNALHSLHSSTLKDRNKDYCILNEALNQFNIIATMTAHGNHVDLINQEDFDDVVETDTEKERREKSDDEKSEREVEDGKEKKDNDNESDESYRGFGDEYESDENNYVFEHPDENTEDDGSKKENDAQNKGQNTQNNSDEKEDDTEKNNKAQSQPEQEQINLETQEEATLHANNNEHSKVIEVEDIVESIAPFSNKGVTCNVMSGKEIGAILSLSTTPDLNNLDHKKLFVSIKSKK